MAITLTVILVLILSYPLLRDWNIGRRYIKKYNKELADDAEKILDMYDTACANNNDTPLEEPTIADIMKYFKEVKNRLNEKIVEKTN